MRKQYTITAWVKYPISMKFKTDKPEYVETSEEGKRVITQAWEKGEMEINANDGELTDFLVEYKSLRK